jgi:hypothetical protein
MNAGEFKSKMLDDGLKVKSKAIPVTGLGGL